MSNNLNISALCPSAYSEIDTEIGSLKGFLK